LAFAMPAALIVTLVTLPGRATGLASAGAATRVMDAAVPSAARRTSGRFVFM
jgi:hypothetical protein